MSTAAFAWKYSKSPHGAAFSLGAGAVFGMSFGQEIANHFKFMEWWQKKTQ